MCKVTTSCSDLLRLVAYLGGSNLGAAQEVACSTRKNSKVVGFVPAIESTAGADVAFENESVLDKGTAGIGCENLRSDCRARSRAFYIS